MEKKDKDIAVELTPEMEAELSGNIGGPESFPEPTNESKGGPDDA